MCWILFLQEIYLKLKLLDKPDPLDLRNGRNNLFLWRTVLVCMLAREAPTPPPPSMKAFSLKVWRIVKSVYKHIDDKEWSALFKGIHSENDVSFLFWDPLGCIFQIFLPVNDSWTILKNHNLCTKVTWAKQFSK